MKGELTLKILELLEEAATTAVDLGVALAGGGSMMKVQQEFGRRHFSRSPKIQKTGELIKKRNRFSKLLHKLKKEGLIVQNNNQILRLTQRGKKKLEFLKSRFNRFFPKRNYEKQSDDKFKIVIFDVPESQKQKRNWLRSALVGLDFTMLQKSVWLGKNKIPEDLMEDLEKLEILPFVEIFEISKKGTVESISRK